MTYTVSCFAELVLDLKNRFFESDDFNFMLRKSATNDRFSSVLFLYALTNVDFLNKLLVESSHNPFVRKQLRNLYALLNETAFAYKEVEVLVSLLRTRFNYRQGMSEVLRFETTDRWLETMQKMFHDLYLKYRANTRLVSMDERTYVEKLLASIN